MLAGKDINDLYEGEEPVVSCTCLLQFGGISWFSWLLYDLYKGAGGGLHLHAEQYLCVFKRVELFGSVSYCLGQRRAALCEGSAAGEQA